MSKRVAFIACGLLREFSSCYPSWNIFDSQDNYVFTWDLDYKKTGIDTRLELSSNVKTQELYKAKKEKGIINYEIYKDENKLLYNHKNSFLWSYVEDRISYDYDYVLLTRPDMFIKVLDGHSFSFPKENEIQTNHLNLEARMVSDTIFFMRRTTYALFAKKIFTFISSYGPGSIHHILTDFFNKNAEFIVNNNLQKSLFCEIYRPSLVNQSYTPALFPYHIVETTKLYWDKFHRPDQHVHYDFAIVLLNNTIATPDERFNFLNSIQNQLNKHYNFNFNYKIFESSSKELGIDKVLKYTEISDKKINKIVVCNMQTGEIEMV
jgi:hypothetical protein